MYDVRNPTADTILMETKLCEDIRTIRLRRNGTSPLGFAIRGGKLPVVLLCFFVNNNFSQLF